MDGGDFDQLFREICATGSSRSHPRLVALFEMFVVLARPIFRSQPLPSTIEEDDVLDAVFIKLIDRMDGALVQDRDGGELRSPAAYARAAIRNAVVDHLREHQRHARRRASDDELATIADPSSVERASLAREELQALQDIVLREWTPLYSDAFFLRVVCGEPYERIAELQQTTTNNVQQRVSRVLKFLRQQLRSEPTKS